MYEMKIGYRACWYPLVGLAVVAIAGCSGPADEKLVTGSTEKDYRASLEPISAKLTPHELGAFNWAVSDFDLAKLHRQYPNASPRDVIRGEVRKVKETYPSRIVELKREYEEQAPLRAELSKIVARGTQFRVERNFFGLKPVITATVVNGSRLPVSRLSWRASLYLGNATTPAATSVLSNDYRGDGGLSPGGMFAVTFQVGFVTGDESWTTLEIRNAQRTRVTLEPVLTEVRDFGDRTYLPNDPRQQIAQLQAGLKAAETFSDI